MFEGTKHEKIVLVILAYVIGLTSGFIGFGINDHYQYGSQRVMGDMDMMEYFDEEPSSTLPATGRAGYVSPTTQPPEANTVEADVVYEDGQLLAMTNEGPVVLSVDVEQLGDSIPEALAVQGYHTEPPIFLASPEGKYVYFCEQHLGVDECTNFLFNINDVSIQYVQIEKRKFVSPTSQAASAYWALDGLHIGKYTSESVETPWKLVEKGE